MLKSSLIFIFCIFSLGLIPLDLLNAKGGDRLRDQAPVAALLFDIREGYDQPLIDAYFDQEIDYFLTLEAPQSAQSRELALLQSVGEYLSEGQITSAEQNLASIQHFLFHKQYFQAVINASRGRYEQALEGFRQLIDHRLKLSRRLSSLAFLGAARIFHEIGDYSQAIYHYNQIRQLDPLFFQAVFEKAWSFYLSGDMNGALGASLAFFSPYGDGLFYPEIYIVQAAAFYQLCYFDRANLSLERLKKDYDPVLAETLDLMRQSPGIWLFNEQKQAAIHQRIIARFIQDNAFRSLYRSYLKLHDESERIKDKDQIFILEALQQVQTFGFFEAQQTSLLELLFF